MNKKEAFYIFNPHRFHLVGASLSDITNFGWSLTTSESLKVAVRFLRGKKMVELESLFSEFAAALQFPYYFGENWDALDECLADLEWIEADAYILIITDFNLVLSKESEEQFQILVNVFQRVTDEWNQPVLVGESWDRSAKAFHVIFQSQPSDLEGVSTRLRSTGIPFQEFDIKTT